MRQQAREPGFITLLAVYIHPLKNLFCHGVLSQIDHLHHFVQQINAIDAMLPRIKQYIVPLIVGRIVNANKMVSQWADQNQIPLLQLVFSILNHAGSVSSHKIKQFISIVGVHGIDISRWILGYLMLEEYGFRIADIVIFHASKALSV